jgi:hypothetical protein
MKMSAMPEKTTKLSDEQKAEMIRLWQQRKTASYIAGMFGVSRNAVIGIMTRMRNKGEDISSRSDRKKPKPVKPVRQIKSIFDSKVEIDGNPTDILGLKNRSCRFIVQGTGVNAKFCNADKWYGAYCEEHYKLCYIPTRRAHITEKIREADNNRGQA